MITSVIRCKFNALRRDRIAALMVFILPIVFFSIFAGIMGNTSGGTIKGVTVLLVDESNTDASRALIKSLKDSGTGMRISLTHGDPQVAWTRDAAKAQVAEGAAPAAVIIPNGLGLDMFGEGDAVPVDVYVDPSNPIASTMIPGLLQKAAMDGMRGEMIKGGLQTFEKYAGPMSTRQKEAMKHIDAMLDSKNQAEPDARGKTTKADGQEGQLKDLVLPVDLQDVRQESTGETRSMIAYYFAGIGVMFLLFSTTNAAGTLLEDEEAGILDRMLCTQLGMGRLLLANWIWVTLLGLTSMVVLLLFATFVFGLGPWTWSRIVAVSVMTLFTAAAASSLGMVLASICRSRAQLTGVSTVIILVMSALGGSMMPKFIMPEIVQEIGKATFNSWAMEGYLEVFWYSKDDVGLWTLLETMVVPLAVLLGMMVVFMVCARLFARRWETN